MCNCAFLRRCHSFGVTFCIEECGWNIWLTILRIFQQVGSLILHPIGENCIHGCVQSVHEPSLFSHISDPGLTIASWNHFQHSLSRALSLETSLSNTKNSSPKYVINKINGFQTQTIRSNSQNHVEEKLTEYNSWLMDQNLIWGILFNKCVDSIRTVSTKLLI